MKRSLSLWVGVIVLIAAASTVASGQAQQQPLGDYARAVKRTKAPAAKTAAKVYDNDNLPPAASINVAGDDSKPASDQDSKAADQDAKPDPDKPKNPDDAAKQEAPAAEKKPEAKLKPGQSAEDRQKALDAVKEKLAGQKDKISLLSRELDVLQREHQLKAAEFYANTARRTQNPNGFQDEDAKYKQQIADKQKQLDEAKGKLSGMEDEAHKAGAPNSITQ
jgi:hypothetical protein